MIGPHGSPAKLISNNDGFPVAVSPNVLGVVIVALREAWQIICGDPGKHLAQVAKGNPEEDRYTDALCEILSYWLYASTGPRGFNADVFDSVERGANQHNYASTVINKQPDLIIRLANAPLVQARRYVGIFAETKVVSKTKGMSKYTKEGVSRFVDGDYAWAMQDGVMIAYRKQPLREIETLRSPLKNDATLLVKPEIHEHLVQTGLPIPAEGKSTHDRHWTYQKGGVPGAIRLWHLWAFDVP